MKINQRKPKYMEGYHVVMNWKMQYFKDVNSSCIEIHCTFKENLNREIVEINMFLKFKWICKRPRTAKNQSKKNTKFEEFALQDNEIY